MICGVVLNGVFGEPDELANALTNGEADRPVVVMTSSFQALYEGLIKTKSRDVFLQSGLLNFSELAPES